MTSFLSATPEDRLVERGATRVEPERAFGRGVLPHPVHSGLLGALQPMRVNMRNTETPRERMAKTENNKSSSSRRITSSAAS